MVRSKGKTPQRPEGPGRPTSREQESGSASADSAPSRERRQGRGKAHGARPRLEPCTAGGQETPGGRRKPTVEENGDCRRPEAGPPPEAAGRRGSAWRRGCGPKENHKPGDGRGGRLEEKSLLGGGRTRGRDRRRRRGKGRGRSVQRGRQETRNLNGDTSDGDGASSCPDSEAREALESGSQSGGAPERRPNSEQTDMGSGNTQTGPESALEAPRERPSSDGLGSDGRGGDKPPAGPRSPEGSSGARPQGETEDSETDTDLTLEGAGPGRSLRAAPGTTSGSTEAEEADPASKAAASSPLEGSRACVPRSSRASRDPRPARDARNSGVQPEAEPRGPEAVRAEASTARGQRTQVGEGVGKVQEEEGVSEAGAGGEGSRDPAPLVALVALGRLRARPPPGPAPQAAGPCRSGLKDRLLRVARGLGLLRWLRLRPRAGEARAAGEARGRGSGLSRGLVLSLAGVEGLGGRPRAPPGGGSSFPQVAERPAPDDPSEDADPTPDPKFAVIFPRIHRAGRTSSSQSSEEGSADAPAGEGHFSSCAGASGDSEGRRASGEGVAGRRHGSLGPTPSDEPPLERGSSSEAEPETLGAEAPVHWAQGEDPREDPGFGTEALLPRLILETRLRRERSPSPCRFLRDRWEPEDETEEALEKDLELSLGPGLEAPPFPGAEDRSLGEGLEDTEDLARLR